MISYIQCFQTHILAFCACLIMCSGAHYKLSCSFHSAVSLHCFFVNVINPPCMRRRVTVVGSVCVCSLSHISSLDCLFILKYSNVVGGQRRSKNLQSAIFLQKAHMHIIVFTVADCQLSVVLVMTPGKVCP